MRIDNAGSDDGDPDHGAVPRPDHGSDGPDHRTVPVSKPRAHRGAKPSPEFSTHRGPANLGADHRAVNVANQVADQPADIRTKHCRPVAATDGCPADPRPNKVSVNRAH